MDARPGGAGGRGRGRGRATANEPPPEEREVAEQIPQAEPAVLPAIQAIDDLSLGVPDTGRGRSRGRGSGRGRAPGQIEGRGPVVDIFAAGEPAPGVSWGTHLEQQAAAGQFADVEEEAPPSPPHRVQVTPPQGSPGTPEGDPSPLSVIGTERNADAFSADVSASTSQVSKKEDAYPPPVIRCGEKGEKVMLKTNYLWLKLKDGSKGMVEYHVSFNQNIESTRNRRKIVGQLTKFIGPVKVFDGMTLSLPFILPNDVTTLPAVNPLADIDSEERDVLVTITFQKVKQLGDPACIQFFNNLLRRFMKAMKFVELRREFYDLDMIKAYHKHKLEIWPGKNAVAEMQEGGLMVCVNTCNRVLSTDSVFEFYKLVKNDPRCREKFEKFILNKIVLTRYNNKTYKIDEVAWDQTPLTTFEREARKSAGESEAKQISYRDYLKQQYGEEVKVDSQPMLISKVPVRKNDSFRQGEDRSERILALVPELCYTTGLTDDQRSDFRVMTDLAESTRLTPVQRVNGLKDFIKRALGCKEAMEILSEWGLVLEEKIIDVEGRKVDGADLTFKAGGKPMKVGPDFSREGTKSVFDPIHVQKYMIICTQKDTERANTFIREYKSVTKPLGIRVLGTETVVNTRGMRAMDFEKALKDECDSSKCDFVVVLLPGQNEDIYRAVKTFCVSIRPVPSQCIVTKTLGNERKLRSVVIKIALQINCKLGGALWALKLPPKEKFMFVGIDAAHDPLRKTGSVICLVASLNNECTKYFSRGVRTKTHQELGTDSLHMMMNEALDKFREVNGSFPTQVIVFRDGGSHGQLTTIDDVERKAVKKAIDSCKVDIKFTYVVVTKRISQRFFYDRYKKESYENPEPGTVVDKLVTRRYNYDYYVVSQKVGQGTVNPTHFTVLDTNDPIKPDLIHRLSYVTCFMYYNWAGTVRVPAMVQYAHKLSALLIKSVNGPPDPRISTLLYYL